MIEVDGRRPRSSRCWVVPTSRTTRSHHRRRGRRYDEYVPDRADHPATLGDPTSAVPAVRRAPVRGARVRLQPRCRAGRLVALAATRTPDVRHPSASFVVRPRPTRCRGGASWCATQLPTRGRRPSWPPTSWRACLRHDDDLTVTGPLPALRKQRLAFRPRQRRHRDHGGSVAQVLAAATAGPPPCTTPAPARDRIGHDAEGRAAEPFVGSTACSGSEVESLWTPRPATASTWCATRRAAARGSSSGTACTSAARHRRGVPTATYGSGLVRPGRRGASA